MESKRENPLLSSEKSDSGLHIALHPLVLLTISDYVTRHTLRQQKGAIVGGLLGQQDGREITVEHAFDCRLMGADSAVLDEEWFAARLQQMKDVHKSPALDLVGWYAIVPPAGPQSHHVAIQTQLSSLYSESTILLGFHPAAVLEDSVGGKLPLTIYEANVEPTGTGSREEEVEMTDIQPSLKVIFKELPYSVETGQAEMIGIDFVAKGSGNATAVETVVKKSPVIAETDQSLKGKKRQEPEDEEEKQIDDQNILSREEEELVSSLTAKANAIKMLHARINLITAYLEKLPPPYIANGTVEGAAETGVQYTTANHTILRSIQALLNRLALLIPSDRAAFGRELLAEQNDVNLISLLSNITETIRSARDAGRKFAIIEQAKSDRRSKQTGNHESWSSFTDRGMGRTIGGVGGLL